ncbi:ArsR family transcriptional regulator [Geosporobacter subterraneus DSM 17957]|uniref:ArsR family transcriptional regulator n=1 Tax=Geosporobacter subterraneus DSM 17957 TaxID=1121919 RepID=A0A1M6PXJ2_9FIRM|nr:metalloregulator ArsR/SmtB family transcription factor [Geosporobacter subterraneus]SHK12659.1 ArsR family transcriptional regulator [Geosporobacter subterraneus DSM 17957]
MDYEAFFKALTESIRIKIIRLLAHKPMCVCELETILGMSQPRISQHVKILKYAEIVNDEKKGQRSIYSLNQEFLHSTLSDFRAFLEMPLQDISEFQAEYSRICDLSRNRDIKTCKMI